MVGSDFHQLLAVEVLVVDPGPILCLEKAKLGEFKQDVFYLQVPFEEQRLFFDEFEAVHFDEVVG